MGNRNHSKLIIKAKLIMLCDLLTMSSCFLSNDDDFDPS